MCVKPKTLQGLQSGGCGTFDSSHSVAPLSNDASRILCTRSFSYDKSCITCFAAQAGAFVAEIANQRSKPIRQLTVQSSLCDCAAWGLMEGHDLQRLAQEGRIHQDLACLVRRAVQHIGPHGTSKDLHTAMALGPQSPHATKFQIQVRGDLAHRLAVHGAHLCQEPGRVSALWYNVR